VDVRPLFAVADVRNPLGEAGYLGTLAAGHIEGRSPMSLSGPPTRVPSRPAQAAPRAPRRRLLLLLVAMVVAMASGMTPPSARAATDAYVATDVLYLRDEPGTGGAVLTEMYDGEYVTVINGPSEHGWYYLDYAGVNGWAHGKYLSIDGSNGWATEAGAGGGTAWVGTDALNVRDTPSQDGEVLDTLGQGTELVLAGGAEAGFYPILLGGGIGWVWGGYVSWEPVSSDSERWLDVDRSSSTVRMMVGDAPIATYVANMGFDGSGDGFYATALGSYHVYEMYAGLNWTPYGKAYIKYWVGFDQSRLNGFHSYSLNKRGNPIEGGDGPTGGCISTDLQSPRRSTASPAWACASRSTGSHSPSLTGSNGGRECGRRNVGYFSPAPLGAPELLMTSP
jgi:uncharacterized protein YgiM (DUF1202 family)